VLRVNLEFSNFTSALPTLAEQYCQHHHMHYYYYFRARRRMLRMHLSHRLIVQPLYALHKIPKFIMHQNEQCKTNTQLCICILPEVGTKGYVAFFTCGLYHLQTASGFQIVA